MSFHAPKKYQIKGIKNNGYFLYKKMKIIASDQDGWEHVSVSFAHRVPRWTEMCKVKNLFWDETDCVIQYHPPEADYIRNHPFTLHLWRPVEQTIPMPPKWMV